MENTSQKPLELILARNLITSISTPAFLLDDSSRLVFYNEAAGALLGTSFEESGRMDPAQWTSTFGPFDDEGNPIEIDTLHVTEAIQNISDLGTEREVMDAYHPEATYESKDSYEAGGCK